MSATDSSLLRPGLLGRTTVNVVVAISVLYTLLPVLWLVLAASKSRDALFSSDLLSLGDFSFVRNFQDLFAMDGGLYSRWYLNSLLYAVLGAAVGSLLSVACGYAFDKYRFRHKEKLFGLVLAAVMVPQTVLALPLYLMASAAAWSTPSGRCSSRCCSTRSACTSAASSAGATYPTRCWRRRGWTGRAS